MSKCYRIEGTRLVDADTSEIGRAHYLVIHPDQIEQCNKFPAAWDYAKKLGAHFIVPSMTTMPDGEELDALLAAIGGEE